jgi:hypothetical protein
MRRRILLPVSLLAMALAASACSSDSTKADGGVGGGGGATDTGIGTADSGVHPDADPPDTGPEPCVRDQDCMDGEVCDLTTNPRTCVPGKACTSDNDCSRCFNLTNPGMQEECGHGFHVQAYCDTDRGSVCTRALGPCEPCETDQDCGTLHPILGGAQNKCLDYGGGDKFCGRANTAGCPQGFIDDGAGQCKREDGCPGRIEICPAGTPGQPCQGTDQICAGAECPGTGGAKCTNNDVPGALGVCVNFCAQNSDCPADLPVCNTTNGICIAGCSKDSCAGSQVCHANGFCSMSCSSNMDCEDRFGADFYCNEPAQPPPNVFKAYHDRGSCQRKGCERPVDCGGAGLVCDPSQQPYPACVPGCYTDMDCLSGEQCKDPGAAGPRASYNRAECRALARKTDDETIGVCCNPGCTNRNLQCGFNQWCCGETSSAYEDPLSCGTLTSTGGARAEPGQCFDIAPRPFSPFCVQCQANSDCDSQWVFGYNTDPNINGGMPFQEQEWCQGVAMGLGMCSVTCNPDLAEGGNIGCPRLWNCVPFQPGCFQDADCSGLPCIGADPMNMRPGSCQCGNSGQVTAQCPSVYPNLDTVTNPRCVELGQNGEMFCVASYHCQPPPLTQDANGNANYPAACLQ